MRMTSLPQSGAGTVTTADDDVLDALTRKQRDVLDLLLDHKTSKEISRLLGISPHTVDQRIMLARSKLNVGSRVEVAQAYRRLLDHRTSKPLISNEQSDPDIYEQSIYGSSQVDPERFGAQGHFRDDMAEDLPALPIGNGPQTMANPGGSALTEPYYHVLPEVFDGPNGTVLRLGAIALLAMFLVLIVMGGLAMFEQLSHIVDR